MSETSTDTEQALRAEIAYLRGRIAELERERLEHDRRANAAVAAAQERAYWLDRWQLDLNAAVERPAVERARAAARVLRSPIRRLRLLARRFKG